MSGVSVGKALDWMLAGKPVTRQCWESKEYLRYSEILMIFQLWVDGECEELESFEVGGYDMCVQDWVLGTFDPVTGEPIWPEEQDDIC